MKRHTEAGAAEEDAQREGSAAILGAFLTLFVVVSILLASSTNPNVLRPFVGGIVAFELVTTNLVFVVEFWYTPACLERKCPRFVNWWKRVLE